MICTLVSGAFSDNLLLLLCRTVLLSAQSYGCLQCCVMVDIVSIFVNAVLCKNKYEVNCI